MTRVPCILADDEPLARNALARLIQQDDRLHLVGEASTGQEALDLVDAHQPAVCFLDIRMPGRSGLDVAAELGSRCQIIFTTAYDEFAVMAFELQALDYLLKPFGRRRFDQAVSRLEERLQFGESAHPKSQIDDALHEGTLSQLFVRSRGRIIRIELDDIFHIEAADDYVELHTQNGRYLMSVRMKTLEARLDPSRFVRIHRSLMVNLSHVASMAPCGNGRWEVTLTNDDMLVASRAGTQRLRALTE